MIALLPQTWTAGFHCAFKKLHLDSLPVLHFPQKLLFVLLPQLHLLLLILLPHLFQHPTLYQSLHHKLSTHRHRHLPCLHHHLQQHLHLLAFYLNMFLLLLMMILLLPLDYISSVLVLELNSLIHLPQFISLMSHQKYGAPKYHHATNHQCTTPI